MRTTHGVALFLLLYTSSGFADLCGPDIAKLYREAPHLIADNPGEALLALKRLSSSETYFGRAADMLFIAKELARSMEPETLLRAMSSLAL